MPGVALTLASFFLSGEGVDQRGFAHIGASGQGDLRRVDAQELVQGVDGVFEYQVRHGLLRASLTGRKA